MGGFGRTSFQRKKTTSQMRRQARMLTGGWWEIGQKQVTQKPRSYEKLLLSLWDLLVVKKCVPGNHLQLFMEVYIYAP